MRDCMGKFEHEVGATKTESPKRNAKPTETECQTSPKRSHQNELIQTDSPKRNHQVLMLSKEQSVNSRRITSRSVFRKNDSRHETRRGTIPARDGNGPTQSSRPRYLLNIEPNATLPYPSINHVEGTQQLTAKSEPEWHRRLGR